MLQQVAPPITVKCNPSYAQYFAGYIDWNLDGDFLDANEFIDIGYIAKGATGTADIVVPTDADMGEKILRVICRYGTAALNATDGCSTSFNYGETEDYLIEVSDPSPCITNVTVNENFGNGATMVVSASNEISAANIISSGANIEYISSNIISLNSGFEVQAGAVFEAVIGPCQ